MAPTPIEALIRTLAGSQTMLLAALTRSANACRASCCDGERASSSRARE